MKTSIILNKLGRWFFWLLVLVLVIVFIGTVFFIHKYLKTQELSLELKGPEEVIIGVPFDFEVNFFNETQTILKKANLRLVLPEEIIFLENREQRILNYDLGDIGIGSLSRKDFRFLALSGEGGLEKITVTLSYQPSGLPRARFEKKQDFNFLIKEPAVFLDILSPKEILSGEDFEVILNYHNLSSTEFRELRLEIVYPLNFTLKETLPRPSQGNNVWLLDDLKPGQKGKIVIQGNLIGPADSFFELSANLKVSFLGVSYLINKSSASLSISPSPLELSIFLNNQKDYLSRIGETLSYDIFYKNKTGVGLREVILRARLTGIFDFASLESKANFDSLTKTLTWDASNTEDFKVLSAGQQGKVSFRIKLKDHFPIRRLNDKNFTLKIEAEIESPTIPHHLRVTKVSALAELETKVAGLVKIKSKAFFRDARSGIVNRGVWPPRVDQATNYTIHWSIENYSTDVYNIEVRAFLGPGVRFTGQVKTNSESLPVFKERTREVVWLINKIEATKGILSPALQAIFQIEAVPDITQVGKYQILLKETNLKGFDEFSQTNLYSQAAALTTKLPDDHSVKELEGLIRE